MCALCCARRPAPDDGQCSSHTPRTPPLPLRPPQQVCGAAGLLTCLAWGVWAFTAARRQRHPGRWLLLGFLAAAHAAVLLEVLDFAPLLGPQVGGSLVAHARLAACALQSEDKSAAGSPAALSSPHSLTRLLQPRAAAAHT